MVSSKCVAGLSTGMRPVSASNTMNMAVKASAWDGSRNFHPGPWLARTIWLRLVEPAAMATVKMASIIAGSAMAEMVISRLLPIPPNALAGSSPPRARKNRPSASNAHQRQHAAKQAQRGLRRHHRRHQPGAKRREEHAHKGSQEKIHEACSEMTMSLRQKFEQIEIRLPDRRAAPVLQLGLPVADQAAEERRQQEQQGRLREDGREGKVHKANKSKVTKMVSVCSWFRVFGFPGFRQLFRLVLKLLEDVVLRLVFELGAAAGGKEVIFLFRNGVGLFAADLAGVG